MRLLTLIKNLPTEEEKYRWGSRDSAKEKSRGRERERDRGRDREKGRGRKNGEAMREKIE